MQNHNVKISVIMPVYNVEKYLDRAIFSVLNQTFKDFELILVNDGSTDNSKFICEKYVEIDKRVRFIDQKNQGAHTARNNAIDISCGKYMMFFDSDDYVNTNMLNEYGSEMVVSGFHIETYFTDNKYITYDYIPYTNKKDVNNYFDSISFRKEAYLNFDKNMFYPPWNKLFRSSYIKENNIRFPLTYRDDFPFIMEVIRDIKNVTFTKSIYYNFIRKRSDSETQKYVPSLYEKREDEHNSLVELYKYWDLYDDKNSKEMIARRYVDRIIECIVNLFNRQCILTKKQKIDEIKKYLSSENFISCIKYAKPKKIYLKIMYVPLRYKLYKICYIMGMFINFVKTKNIKMFATLKTYR